MTGILCPNLEARILREDGSDADYGEVGELIVRGPTNALGYWNNESATKEAFKDGWLYTGDRFYVDRQDRFLCAPVLFSLVVILKLDVLWSYVDRTKVRNERYLWFVALSLSPHYLQDVFKVSGKQVSPTEIEKAIREHPSQFVTDVAVAGVQGERLRDEFVPRAWIVLSDAGKEQGKQAVLAAFDKWTRSRLSKHKWLRGGFQVVDEVSHN
jgi:acyl-CoA synthetase (AMP-forming)/AMP-acid ligase II